MSSMPKRLLMVRMDRIGDLILSLPVDEAFAPGTSCEWWIPRGLSFITAAAVPPRKAREVTREFSWDKFIKLTREIRVENFDAAVLFHAPWWVSFAIWWAGIPLRAGVKSQWHSFLFLNRAVRQKRSRAEHSELEYNFLLVEQALRLAPGSLTRTHLKLAAGADRATLLAKWQLREGEFTVVHPGMSGSALNWPSERYIELIRRYLREGETIVITGTAADEPYLAPLRTSLALETKIVWLDCQLNGAELISVLSAARKIIAPSTGVLHLAASTGQPTVGLYSPVRVQQPRRWGPRGERTTTLMPRVDCPGEMRCLGPTCPHYDCMLKISVEQVYETGDETDGEK